MCHELMAHPLFFEKQLIKNLSYLEQFYDMQLVTPREAAIAVKIDITI